MSSLRAINSRPRDPTFEKLMSVYKHYIKAVSIRNLILSSDTKTLPLAYLAPPQIHLRLNLNKGPKHFLNSFPHIFTLFPDPTTFYPMIKLTDFASRITDQERVACSGEKGVDEAVYRIVRILMMSRERKVPLRAVFRAWRELGLPDDFEELILKGKRDLFRIEANPKEKNTHTLGIVDGNVNGEGSFVAKIEEWRERRNAGNIPKKVDDLELRYGFKQAYPPGMKLSKNYRSKQKEWQCLPYIGPYETFNLGPKRSKEIMKKKEKRAVGIVHEFLSLTVEKMAEVEQVSQFRNCFDIDLNIMDLFLDHPGIFYLSTKGKRHTVFLREAYEKGRLIEPNPLYDARRKFLELVAMRRRGLVFTDDAKSGKSTIGEAEEGNKNSDI